MADRPSSRVDFLRGTLDLLILRTLSADPTHGHDIATSIRRRSEDVSAGRKHLVGEETKWDKVCRAMMLVLKVAAQEAP
jgi:hypothetical protein